MRPYRLALFTALAALPGYPLWLVSQKPASAYAAETRPTPGQLTILDRQGKSAGLCPLKHTDVTADIAGYVARVTVQQEFHNPTNSPIEAVYTFPLPADAAVDDMTMTLGSRIVKGQIKRREEAREIYEAAKSQGKAAALLDQERPNIFTQSVANIMPGEKVHITISYVNLLKYEEGRYEFVFPMVVGPRFVPGGGYTTPGQRGAPSPAQTVEEDPGKKPVVRDADKITPPITPPGTRAGHDISLTVRLDAGLPLTDVRSQLHPIDIRRQGPTRAVLRLRNQQEIPNKDFILRYTAAGSEVQSGMLTHARQSFASTKAGDARGTNGYFTLILQPPLAPPKTQVTPKEMVFVIDQTGSQSGWPIKKAKETMRYCIQNLNPGDTFQLLGFNTQVYPCFPAPVPATRETIAQALKFLEPIEGSGGTDILKAADYALKIPDDPDRLRIICYMTDGYVGNDMQIIDYIGKNRGRARMFPFGVGNGVNRFLVDGMAREGRGAADYVTLDTPGEAAAAKFYKRIASPLLLDIHVDWNGLPVEDVYPKHIPDVFSAGPIILKGRFTRASEGDITIRGLLRGKPWQRTLHVAFPAAKAEGSALPTLWARERIEDLQNQDWIGAQTGHTKPEITNQIIATALEYRLMSQYTSFVAVEERVVNVGGKQRTLDVPVEMPEGVAYEGIFGKEKNEADVRLGRAAQSRTLHFSQNQLGAQAYGFQAGSGGGGFGGGRGGGKGPAGGLPALNAPALRQEVRLQMEVLGDQVAADKLSRFGDADGIAEGKEAAYKKLAALKPEERHAVLEQAKLAPALHKSKIKNPKSKVEVQVWLNSLPPDGLKRLKALGFELSATLTPNRLLLGTITAEKLDALIELAFVRRVEPPRFKL